MSDQKKLQILEEVLSLPTAPFAEHAVVEYVRQFCDQRAGATLEQDAAGNLLARVRRGDRAVARPACLTAHLDHPGFVVRRAVKGNRVEAAWRGGVLKEYFVGARVRFWHEDRWIQGTVESVKTRKQGGLDRVQTAVIQTAGPVPPGTPAMWDLPEPRIRGQRIHARACDDLAGVAAMLCAIDELCRGTRSCDAWFLFTRAEEVGFAGAIAAARAGAVPKACFLVCIEMSSQLPNARMGDGPILRVGDRASSFTSVVTNHCQQVAETLRKKDKAFKYQRRLMDGGMCESTAFCSFGYEATGLCLALGNYHNMDRKREKIAAEFIDLSDFYGLVRWLIAIARFDKPFTGKDEVLEKRLADIDNDYRDLLHQTVSGPA